MGLAKIRTTEIGMGGKDRTVRKAGSFVPGRRMFLAGAAGAGVVFLAGRGFAQQVVKEISQLKPGEFTWHPERSPEGPVAVVVSIPEQLVHVYRNGVRIAVSTCSTGKPGHSTPTGVFTVLQKDKNHRSSTYNNAPMPNMNRLTWSGIALHAGNLPGYPASHGCVRLPLEFSGKLFGVTHVGTPVIIAGSHTDPRELTHPGLVLGEAAGHEFDTVVAGLKGKSHPADWPEGTAQPVTTVLASTADRKIVLIENDDEVASGTFSLAGGDGKLGEHVFTLIGAHEGQKGMAWHGISHHPEPSFPDKPEEQLLAHIRADKAFVSAMGARMHPGMVLIVTDLPTSPDTRSGKDFVIMTQAETS
jgi:hypothetical protein